MFTEFVVDCNILTFEQALVKFRSACESTCYPVHLSYHKGEFTLTYQKPAFESMDDHAKNIKSL